MRIIATSKREFLKAYEKFIFVDNKYILGNGILINVHGEILWCRSWKHSYSTLFFHKPTNMLITDRMTMIGPVTTSAGLCAIDFSTGKYKWSFWHLTELCERIAFVGRKKTIKLQNLNTYTCDFKYLYIPDYKIDIKTGKYIPYLETLPQSDSDILGLIEPLEIVNCENVITEYKVIEAYNIMRENILIYAEHKGRYVLLWSQV